MKQIIFFICICISMMGCTRPESTRILLEKQGYTDIEITGYSWFACSDRDSFATGFRARKNDNVISGTVCEGFLLKQKIIRFE